MLACCALLVCAAAAAQQDDVYVPEELEPWRDWVLHGREFRDCPFFFDQTPAGPEQAVCAWPGALELTVGAEEARFTQAWTVYATEQWLPLPGDAARWPEGVTADGRPVPVVLHGNAPAVRLAPGRHLLAGRIAWAERPRALSVPRETGLLTLTVDGRRIARPERSGASLWLGEREAAPRTADALSVEVYRLVRDGIPTELHTRFTLEVAGRLREEVVVPALPDGFVPTTLESELPARLESDGRLRLQVRPGTWEVELGARARGVQNEIRLPEPRQNLPASEIWSYFGDDKLRVAVPGGVPPVDPEQVGVPAEFRALPAFRVAPGEALTLAERSRGRTAGDDRLHLTRVLWLDFDGRGFTFSDTVTGTLESGWRLDMAAPYALQSAAADGGSLLVTAGPAEGLTGVELRTSDLDLEAFGRLESRDAVPASGWQARLAGMTAELNLPPGQKLLAAAGADRAPGAWLERWRLLDFFLVLIVTLAAARLFGRAAGALALVALVLSWHEPGAPHWAWLNALAAFALVRVAPPGRLHRVALAWRGLSLLAVVGLLVPFVAGQLRIAIYPQLEPQRATIAFQREEFAAADDLQSAPMAPDAAARRAAKGVVEEIVVSGNRVGSYARYAPNAIVQAGPGRPTWRWNTYDLEWSGPVEAERTLDLWILPRWLVTALRSAAVLLLLAFAAVFALDLRGRGWRDLRPAGGPGSGAAPAAGGVLLAALGLCVPPPAAAETPPPEILQALEARLLEPPPCAPRCAELVAADVAVAADALTVHLEVHAEAEVAVPLPGSPQGWRPERVVLDGAAGPPLFRRADGTLWVRATAGRHTLELSGALPPVDTVEVPFPAPPRVVTARAEGWSLAGIEERILRTGSLTLTRVRETAADGGARWDGSRFPAYLRVERTVELDLDWRVTTAVWRIAPAEGAIALDIPLLPGASLLTADLPVEDGRVRVAFGPAEQVVEWSAALPRTAELVLEAPVDAPWTEVWRFGVGNVWHATFAGVPESEPAGSSRGGARIAEFHPRAGEALTLAATRPTAIPGGTLAFDSVALATEIGARSRTATLDLAYRSTRGAQHVIRLPESARVQDVTIDGADAPLRAEGGELGLPILPGEHRVTVRWQQEIPVGARVATSAVDLGAAAGNVSLGLDLPPNRWVLATAGPRLGPAVMYWPEVAALLLFALLLGRTSLTPLGTRHWLLLGLGFSTFSWPVLALVVAWLLATGARARAALPDSLSPARFNALQIAFALLSIAALVAIVVSVPAGLLGAPDMHVAGNGSYGNHLRWLADRSAGPLATAAVFSLPLWVYKVLILAWALWLSFALLRWLPWAWRAFVAQGLWRGPRRPQPAPEVPV